jgi:hypothetical protein
MMNTALLEDIEVFADMIQEVEEGAPGTALEVLRLLSETFEIDLEQKPPHPIMRRDPELVFPNYKAAAAVATEWLEKGLYIFNAPEAKHRLMVYLTESKAFGKDIRAGREKATVSERVYLEMVTMADEYLEVYDAQSRVEEKLKLKQSNVSRSFKRLQQVKLIEKHGFCPQTGRQVWRLKTPVESTVQK